MVHWFCRCLAAASRAPLLGRVRPCGRPCAAARPPAAASWWPRPAPLAAAVRDGCWDDERDLALVHELRCGADDVDDGGAVAAVLLVSASASVRNDSAPVAQMSPASSSARPSGSPNDGAWLHANQVSTRLDGVGDGDLDDPRDAVDR